MKRSGLASVLLPSALALLAPFFTASSTFATTFYVSNGGSDSNNGTSKTTPWAHVPGMASATGTAGSYSAVPGDTFILRGCDVWYNSNFPMALSRGGSSGNPVTITVDQTWYNTTSCPSTWNRPIFDAITSSGSSAPMEINGSGGQSSGCVGGNGNYFVAFTASYITLSWVEMRNLYYANDAQNTCWAGNGWWRADSVDYITVSNSYEHAWSMGTYSANKVGDADILVWVDGSPACPHCRPDPTVHDNVIETVDAQGNGGVYYIHDNRLHDYYSGEGLQVGNPGETDYVWNNSWYGLLQVGGNGPQVPQSETPVAMYFWNNAIVGWGDCINDASHGYTWSGAFYSQNNLCINSTGSNGSGSPSAKPVTISNNLGLTDAQATADGYAASQALPFSPASGSSVTVSAGANLTSLWPAGFSTADASLICTQQTVNTVVESVCSGTPNARPANGAWDIGPYQFGAGSTTSKLLPPTGLKATVQ